MKRINGDLFLLRFNETIPNEIYLFFNEVFELIDVRQKIGNSQGISFIIHKNEANHSIPHVHATYGEFEISISILDQKVLAGNLPKKNEKIAIQWVRENKESLLNRWKFDVISGTYSFKKTNIK